MDHGVRGSIGKLSCSDFSLCSDFFNQKIVHSSWFASCSMEVSEAHFQKVLTLPQPLANSFTSVASFEFYQLSNAWEGGAIRNGTAIRAIEDGIFDD